MTVTAKVRGTPVDPSGGEIEATKGGTPSSTMSPRSSGELLDESVKLRMARPGSESLRIVRRLVWKGTPTKLKRPSVPVTTVRPMLLVTSVTKELGAGSVELGAGLTMRPETVEVL